MKKGVIIIIVILIIILSIILFFIKNSDNNLNYSNKVNARLELCRNASETVQSECYLELAIDEKDIKICDELGEKIGEVNGKFFMNSCKAYVTGDLSYCEEVAKDIPLLVNSNGCYVYVSYHFNNSEACKFIMNDDNEREKCYYALAIKLQDLEICKKIVSENMKERCLEEIS